MATSELVVGDVVDWHGERRRVIEIADTDQPATFGYGTACNVTLLDSGGNPVALVAAASQRWLRVYVVITARRM